MRTITCSRFPGCTGFLTDGKPCPGTLEESGEGLLEMVGENLPTVRFTRAGCPAQAVRNELKEIR